MSGSAAPASPALVRSRQLLLVALAKVPRLLLCLQNEFIYRLRTSRGPGPAVLPAPSALVAADRALVRQYRELYDRHSSRCRACYARGQDCCRHRHDGDQVFSYYDCYRDARPFDDGWNRQFCLGHYLDCWRWRWRDGMAAGGQTCRYRSETGCRLPPEQRPFACHSGLCGQLAAAMTGSEGWQYVRITAAYSWLVLGRGTLDLWRALARGPRTKGEA